MGSVRGLDTFLLVRLRGESPIGPVSSPDFMSLQVVELGTMPCPAGPVVAAGRTVEDMGLQAADLEPSVRETAAPKPTPNFSAVFLSSFSDRLLGTNALKGPCAAFGHPNQPGHQSGKGRTYKAAPMAPLAWKWFTLTMQSRKVLYGTPGKSISSNVREVTGS